MSGTEFAETEKKEEKPLGESFKLPTFDVFGFKIKQDDAQNFLLVVLGLATGAMAINTFAPRLNPFNKPQQKVEEKEDNKKQTIKQAPEQVVEGGEDIIEYPQFETLEINNPLEDVVDRVYDDPKTIYQEYRPNKRLSYKEIDDIFGSESKILKKRSRILENKEENELDISSDLL